MSEHTDGLTFAPHCEHVKSILKPLSLLVFHPFSCLPLEWHCIVPVFTLRQGQQKGDALQLIISINDAWGLQSAFPISHHRYIWIKQSNILKLVTKFLKIIVQKANNIKQINGFTKKNTQQIPHVKCSLIAFYCCLLPKKGGGCEILWMFKTINSSLGVS